MRLSRPTTAFLVAPLATVPVLALGGSLVMLAGGKKPDVEGVLHASFFFAFFGLPIAYVVTAVIGFPLYRALLARNMLTWRTVMACGAAIGALLMPVIWRSFLGPVTLREAGLMATIGTLMGVASSIVFAAIALRLPDT